MFLSSFILTMWYVNLFSTRYIYIPVTSFILTMWYVNGEINKHIPVYYLGFYINYVICKFSCLFQSFQLNLCFILTMWYVNFLLIVCAFITTYRFILTMWYVNLQEDEDEEKTLDCFILTMWYVNSLRIHLPSIISYLFYINYVICKYT